MDYEAVCLPCCVGIRCRECSWLGVRRMLRNEGLAMGYMGELLYLRVRRGG